MPTPGLTLLGFMSQEQAFNYLRNGCVLPDTSDAALLAHWNAARAMVGNGPLNAGNPVVQDIPAAQAGHIQSLRTGPWQANIAADWQFRMVEIAPLLAFQFSILTDKTDGHCNGFSTPPTMEQLLNTCLPLVPAQENLSVSHLAQSILIRGKNLNLRTVQTGMLSPNALGLTFGFSLPFVHVVRLNGRCYLHNGFHRVYGAAKAGAKEVPCVFRDVANADAAGIRQDGTTFDLTLLESANPPTMHHFASGQAYAVQLKIMSRVINVSWSDYVVPDEY